MRVISGSAGGIPLEVPKTDLRPTMDQVRGAIFSSLAAYVENARVLDLFAGSGGLGIEALSRGAQSAWFVEQNRKAVQTLEKNLTKTRLGQNARVFQCDAFAFLDRLLKQELPPFDLIFADPPYTKTEDADPKKDFSARLVQHEAFGKLLVPGEGIFVLEKAPRSALPEVGANWEIIRQKTYGGTEVLFLRRKS